MGKICYIDKNFRPESLTIIDQANEIIEEYENEGLKLTLRQLYYQFVSRDQIANIQSEYKRLGKIISDGRLAGLIDWAAIEDRTRNLQRYYHNTDPGNAIQDALDQFQLNKWIDQPYYPEVWIEKEALTGVIDNICRSLDVPYFACKGYVSQSEMWVAAIRMRNIYCGRNQTPVIIHLGDHDPSGMDMTRDIEDRLELFNDTDKPIIVERIALNYDQIEEYKPPPNPTKLTDTRASDYMIKYGNSSWELDALEPKIIRDLISTTVDKYIDIEILQQTTEQEDEYREILENIVDNWKNL